MIAGRRAGLLAAAFVVAVAPLGACAASTGPPGSGHDPATFTNPVYAGDAPDPQAIHADGNWYLVHTNEGGQNVPMLTSPDLVNWTPAGDALPDLPGWAVPGKTWAPEISATYPHHYVLFYSAADRRSGRECVGRAVAETAQGPYRDDSPTPLVCPEAQGGAIDPSPFRDSDGSLWLLWKNDGNAIGADTWLWSQRLSADGRRLVGQPARLLKQTRTWEGALVEGPFFWRHGGTLFLFFAANAYASKTYAEGYAVCTAPTGACVEAPENPILRSNTYAAGPGHASMIVSGGRTWLLYHAWQPGREGTAEPGRQLWLDEVTWEDGKPRVHGPTGTPQARPEPGTSDTAAV